MVFAILRDRVFKAHLSVVRSDSLWPIEFCAVDHASHSLRCDDDVESIASHRLLPLLLLRLLNLTVAYLFSVLYSFCRSVWLALRWSSMAIDVVCSMWHVMQKPAKHIDSVQSAACTVEYG